MKNIVISIDPFLARKIEVIARKRKTTFTKALIFLLQRVITPKDENKA